MEWVTGIFKLFFQDNLQAALSLVDRKIIYILGVRKGRIAGQEAGQECPPEFGVPTYRRVRRALCTPNPEVCCLLNPTGFKPCKKSPAVLFKRQTRLGFTLGLGFADGQRFPPMRLFGEQKRCSPSKRNLLKYIVFFLYFFSSPGNR